MWNIEKRRNRKMAEYPLKPVDVPAIETKYRTIKTKIPVPQSIYIFEQLKNSEPRSMMGQPPILWHKADNSACHQHPPRK